MMSRFQQFVKDFQDQRWRKSWLDNPDMQPLESAMRSSLNSVAALCIKKAELKEAGKLSEKGLVEETRLIARTKTVPELKSASEAVEKIRVDLGSQRTALAMPSPDPLDLSGAVVRSDMRSWLRGLPNGQAMQHLLADDVDERLLAAALEVPPAMAGLTVQTRTLLQDSILAKKHGTALARLDEMKEAADTASAAITTALYQLQQEIEFGDGQQSQFDEWMKAA